MERVAWLFIALVTNFEHRNQVATPLNICSHRTSPVSRKEPESNAVDDEDDSGSADRTIDLHDVLNTIPRESRRHIP